MGNQVTDFIFKITANRVKEHIISSNLRYKDVYEPDEKLICRIINNKRGKNNPYLIPDAVFYNHAYNCGLLGKNLFSNKHEVLWGNPEEIKSYAPSLFPLLIDMITSDFSYDFDVENLLCDYVPYAISRAYWDILFSTDHENARFHFCEYDDKILNFPAIAYGFSEDELFENFDTVRDNAISFLYNRCEIDFIELFIDFTNNTLSFKKLDKVINDSLIKNRLFPMLNKYIPDASSLGLRVRNLIYEDVSYIAPLVFQRKLDNPTLRAELVIASLDYAAKLEKIQATYYPLKKEMELP